MAKTTEQKVREIIQKNATVTLAADDSDTLQDLGFDSLDRVEMVLLLEDEFELDILDEDLAGPLEDLMVKTVIDYVNTKLAEKKHA